MTLSKEKQACKENYENLKQEHEKNIGAGKFEYTQQQVKIMKEKIKSKRFDYSINMFKEYNHHQVTGTFLDKYTSLTEFLMQQVKFKDVSNEEILNFINKHSQEIRDIFICQSNKDADDEESVFPYESYYELNEDFHLIRKLRLWNYSEELVIRITFLFADILCALWKKYNNCDMTYKFIANGIIEEIDNQPVGPNEIYLLKEDFLWNIDTRQ